MSGNSRDNRNEEYFSIIHAAVQDVRYGTVTINIQDGVIVQVEKSERYRLKESEKSDAAGRK